MSISDVKDVVNGAQEYQEELKNQILLLIASEKQVKQSAAATRLSVNGMFDDLLASIVSLINHRRGKLLSLVDKFETKGLQPLEECHTFIKEKLHSAQKLVNEGELLLNGSKPVSKEEVLDLNEKSSVLGSLPAVPPLAEVSCISVSFPEKDFTSDVKELLSSYGTVYPISPVQFGEIVECPGGITAQWELIEDASNFNIQQYELQYCFGDHQSFNHIPPTFHTSYRGKETAYTVHDLRSHVPYTFRIRCCWDNEETGKLEWSPWSMPLVFTTSLEAYTWDPDNPNYFLTNEGKIATKSTSEPACLLSSSPMLLPGNTIEFKVLDSGVGCSDEGLALIDVLVEGDNFLQPGALFVNAQGTIYLDGVEKQTRISPLRSGHRLTFFLEELTPPHVRVHVTAKNHRVTYDWKLKNYDGLYFAMNFGEEGWKVAVR